jgi:hypothetical protein
MTPSLPGSSARKQKLGEVITAFLEANLLPGRGVLSIAGHIDHQAVILSGHDPASYHLLQSLPGIGKVLGLVLLYEIQDIQRFPENGNFLSYARLVRCEHESAAKKKAPVARRSATPISCGPAARRRR